MDKNCLQLHDDVVDVLPFVLLPRLYKIYSLLSCEGFYYSVSAAKLSAGKHMHKRTRIYGIFPKYLLSSTPNGVLQFLSATITKGIVHGELSAPCHAL